MAQQKAAEAQADNVDDIVDELPPGTKLLRGQYTIVRFLNSGGFGITYLARDSLDRNVVIKECFPSSYCRRSKTVVAARSRAHTAELRSVVQLFVREARNLAKIVHPNIVAVHQVFEDNFTAYMAIDFIDGLDLQEVIEGKGPQLTPQDVVVITEKLLGAVGFIHDHDMLHRDISPDNVLIDKSGEPILIDFGAARDEASAKNRAMSALRVVKDGYSPQEFYIAGSEQGPWSDLYALGATLYHLISGEAPTNGQARLAALAEGRPDPYIPLDGRFAGFPPGFLKAIDKAMNTLPAQRLQNARDWLAMFHSATDVEGVVRALMDEPPARPVSAVAPDDFEVPMAQRGEGPADDGFASPAGFGTPPEYAGSAASTGAGAASSGRSGGPMIAVGVLLLVAALGGGYMMMGGKDAPAASGAAPATADTGTSAQAGASSQADAAPVADATTASSTAAGTTTEPAAAPTAASTSEDSSATATAAAETSATAEPAKDATASGASSASATDTTATAASDSPQPAAAIATPVGPPSPNQITFAAWDAAIPFVEENRMVNGSRVTVVSRILPATRLSEVGDWLKPGLVLYTVNGRDIQDDGSLTAALLNAMQVDPDGKARVVVEYSTASGERESGLLTVDASRLVNLANGVTLRASVLDGEWKTVVTGVTNPEKTELHQGDVLFRDKTTGIAIDSADAIETALAKLVEAGTSLTTFSVIRDDKVLAAAMQLAVEP